MVRRLKGSRATQRLGHNMHVHPTHQRMRFLQDWYNPGNILDAGCGEGKFSITMKELENDVWAIDMFDVSERMNKHGIKFEQTTLEDYEPPKGFFDTVILMEVLEHLEEPEEIVEKLYNSLKSNGVMLITTPNVGDWDNDPDHIWRWHKDELQEMLRKIAPEILVWIDNIFIYAVLLKE